MKFDWKIILVLVLLAALVFRECSRPSKPDFADQAFKDTIEVLRQEKAVIQSRQEATVKTYHRKVQEDSSNIALQDTRIQALQTKLANQRPKVIEKIQADTAVLSYVNTLEEVVTELQVQNDTLKSQVQFQRKINEDLILLEAVEDRVEADITLQTSVRIADLERRAKKKERKSKLKTILIPVAAVAGLLFGSQI